MAVVGIHHRVRGNVVQAEGFVVTRGNELSHGEEVDGMRAATVKTTPSHQRRMGSRLAQQRLRFDVEQLNVAFLVARHEQLSVLAESARVGDIEETRKGLDALARVAGIEHHAIPHNRLPPPTSFQKSQRSDTEPPEKMQCDSRVRSTHETNSKRRTSFASTIPRNDFQKPSIR